VNIGKLVTSSLARYGLSVVAVGVVTGILFALGTHVNLTTIALAFLLVVLSTATFFGRNPALVASFAAMLSFNYLFVPPVLTWHIADPQNLVAWAAFTITAIITGELSSYARRRAREAERLYQELQSAFESATEAEALRHSEKLKSALLDAVTHDLRTPLTSIKASVTTLLDSEGGHRTIELNSEGRGEFLNIINEETDRLNAFIEGMVQLARVEANSGVGEQTLANVEEIVAIALERAEPVIAEHHVTVNIERDLPLIKVEARAIAEALYNLIENAAKYSPANSMIVVTAESANDSVKLSVEDEGPGIPVEMRERVFEKFVRLDGERTDGLGLGLAIVRGIVEAQDGAIEISDGAAKGTRISISLPVGS
jgi:two-component system sensor histidine kinase KdpD